MPPPPPVSRLLPSLAASGPLPDETKVTLSMGEVRALLDRALAAVEVDENWYLRQYPDVRDGIARGANQSAAEHYRHHGYLESRLPSDPAIDEDWYRASNPDVATGIRQGKFRTAKEHYIRNGYSEGRAPQAETSGGAAAAAPFVPRPRF
ncbi:MAG TPA: hypothetical protein VGR91_07580 [Stellaceae bacterium]|nr:hypothetical protein [Stellaceae bacterium]